MVVNDPICKVGGGVSSGGEWRGGCVGEAVAERMNAVFQNIYDIPQVW